MKELTLPRELSCEIREIYDSMVAAYDEVSFADLADESMAYADYE